MEIGSFIDGLLVGILITWIISSLRYRKLKKTINEEINNFSKDEMGYIPLETEEDVEEEVDFL